MLEKIEDFEYKVLMYVCVDAFMNACIHIHAYIFSYIYAHTYVCIIVPRARRSLPLCWGAASDVC
jgi:hypothetical protein